MEETWTMFAAQADSDEQRKGYFATLNVNHHAQTGVSDALSWDLIH